MCVCVCGGGVSILISIQIENEEALLHGRIKNDIFSYCMCICQMC